MTEALIRSFEYWRPSMTTASPTRLRPLISLLDITRTIVFAVEGALAAIHVNLHLFGVLVLSFVTALRGDVIRAQCVSRSALFVDGVCSCYRDLRSVRPRAAIPIALIQTIDAAFRAVRRSGRGKGARVENRPFISVLLGGITGVGGDTIRDLLLAHVPLILQADAYATAALLRAAIVVVGRAVRVPPSAAALAGGLACFALRVVSLQLHWGLPKAASF